MKEKDIKNFDYLDIIVKKISEDEIVDAYSAFLWEKIDKKEDERYNDVVHLSFRRPHKIQNKDRLQLLEVYYQSALELRAGLEIKKHSKSKVNLANLIFFSAIFIFGVGVFIYLNKTLLSVILGSVFALFVLSGAIFLASKIKKLFIKENNIYLEKLRKINDEINGILSEANALTKKENLNGEKNEEI